MNTDCINELKKLYDDPRVSPILQEVCEYYASASDYEEGSYEEEIEPRGIVEPVYLLFLLQRRESMLDELSYIRKRYPALFAVVSPLYDTILTHMDVASLERETAEKLCSATGGGHTASKLISKAEELSEYYDDISEALDPFYSYLHSS